MANLTPALLRQVFYNKGMGKIIKFTGGIIAIILGVIALLTPLTPGSWLIFIGLELLGISSLKSARKNRDKEN